MGCDKRGLELGATDSEARSRARARLCAVSTVNPFESLDKSLWRELYAFAYKQAFIAAINALRVCLPAKATVPRAVNLLRYF